MRVVLYPPVAINNQRLAGSAHVVCATSALAEHIRELHAENYGVYGVRKMWHTLARQGIVIGREQTARLMRLAGVAGKPKGKSPVTTRKRKGPDNRPDLVNRDFTAHRPNQLWVG